MSTAEVLKELAEGLEGLVNAPNGLRVVGEIIGDLAVKGTLTCGRSYESTGAELLEEIKLIKAEVARRGRSRRVSDVLEAHRFENLPSHWTLASLGDVADTISDGTHHTPKYVPEGVKFVSIKNISGGFLNLAETRFITAEEHRQLTRRVEPRRGDILIARIGTLGVPVIVDTDEPFSIFVSVGLIRVNHELVDVEYLKLVLGSATMYRVYDAVKAGGSHTNKLNLTTLAQLPIPLPPLDEQRDIVQLHSRLDGKLAATADAVRARERARVAFSRAAFTALGQGHPLALDHLEELLRIPDDVNRARDAIATMSVSGRLTATAKDSSEVQGLGGLFSIPRSWSWKQLGDLTSYIQRGKSPKYSDDSGVMVLSQKCVRWTGLDLTPARTIEKETLRTYSEDRIVREGDLLINSTGRGTVGRACVAEGIGDKIVVADSHVTVCRLDEVDPEYLALWFRSNEVQSRVETWVSGSTNQLEWNLASLKRFPVPLPPRQEQTEVVRRWQKLSDILDRVERALAGS